MGKRYGFFSNWTRGVRSFCDFACYTKTWYIGVRGERAVQVHGIIWHTNEWGTQRVVIRERGHSVKGPPPHYTAWESGFDAGYVKIWRNKLGERRVVDRALTVKRAKERIREMRNG